MEDAKINFSTSMLIAPEQKMDEAAEIIKRIEPGVRLSSPETHDRSRHSHVPEEGDSGRRDLIRVVIAVVAFALGWVPRLWSSLPVEFSTGLFLIAFAAAGYPVISVAFRNLRQKAL
ncbi:MAG: hypothetical protein ACLFS8_02235, partial [Clostridia bacterium]